MDRGISVNFIIKNGLVQGYAFWESLKSCLAFASEVVVSDGFSTDGTFQYVEKFARMFSSRVPIQIYRDDWTTVNSPYGEVISVISGINHRRCKYEWIYYLQADEVLHEDSVQFIRDIAEKHSDIYNSVWFPFCHFLSGWEPSPKGKAAYDEAIRMVKNRSDITFLGDAWSFTGATEPSCPANQCPKPIYHLGGVFPKSRDQKAVGHGRIYTGLGDYQRLAQAAAERLARGDYASGCVKPDGLQGYPSCLDRLFGMVEYSPPSEAMD